jgi:D-alanyl-D-alanine carboxypeptidase
VELLPSLAADWRADPAITVAQLLGQVSGLRQAVDSRALIAAGIRDGAEAIGEAARLVVLAGSERAPGERWAYYNGNYLWISPSEPVKDQRRELATVEYAISPAL